MESIVILTVIPVELSAVLTAFGLSDARDKHKDSRSGTVTYQGALGATRIVVSCIAGAGNAGAAGLATELAREFSPRLMLLVGIAAGMETKNRIGEVVIAERIVDYESAALVAKQDGSREEQLRPCIVEVPHSIKQDIAGYQSDTETLKKRFEGHGWTMPWEASWASKVVQALSVSTFVTIASGEKLLRDPAKLREVREKIHGKVEAGEMEGYGFAKAGEQQNVPWCVIRGISDFGDSFKNDQFHALAARAAAVVAVDLLERVFGLGIERVGQGTSAFVWGRPIERDKDFVGREAERTNVLEGIKKHLAVQILGGAKTGRSSLLRWFERHPPKEGPLVRLSPGQGLSPAAFVTSIAEQTGKASLADPLRKKGATTPQISEVLRKLIPFVLLLEDADTLATHGHGFGHDFFDGVLRELIENGHIAWISVSRADLNDLLKGLGRASELLNSSEKIWLGPLEKNAAEKLAGRAGPRVCKRMLEEAGHWAFGLQWLGEHLGRASGDEELVFDEFAEEASRAFRSWWAMLSASERQWLKRCAATEVRKADLKEGVRREVNKLLRRRLLFLGDGAYRLAPGAAWARFVRDER